MTSFANNIPTIIKVVTELKPHSVLDVGSGFGKYGLLIREALLSKRAEETGEPFPKDDIIIDCAEEAQYFIDQPYHDKIYNNHWHGDILDKPVSQVNSYGLVLLIDVVEHWDKDEAIAWLNGLNTNILISTPKHVSYYDIKYYGCRKHVSQWTDSDFVLSIYNDVVDYSTEDSHIYLIRRK